VRIAVVGDFEPRNETHVATTSACEHAAAALGHPVDVTWIATAALPSAAAQLLDDAAGVFVAPGSPYESLEGALDAIRFSRTGKVPLLGTCGGFQHVVLEYARNVVGVRDAQHAEYEPHASTLFVTPLTCSAAGQTMRVGLRARTVARTAYGVASARERYYCKFGLNPEHRSLLEAAGLVVSGVDQDDEVRIVELPSHPFFVGTLFVPQVGSRPGAPHPLVQAFVDAAARGPRLVIAPDDPRAPDVRALLETHLAFSHEVTPPGHVHALGIDGLLDPAVTFFAARRGSALLGVGALKELDASHGELKSMHTAQAARRQGVGRAMVTHLITVATERHYRRVSLETGTMAAFEPARSLYASMGFEPCDPFGEYTENPHSICMSKLLA
jgi:GNAT superfamily N-acetyltransferase